MSIADITQIEQWTLRSCLEERWGKDRVDFELVEVEARLEPGDRELTECPAFFWEHDDCHYIIMKTGDKSWRCQFYYRNLEQFGTGVHEYEDLGDCALALLRLQADHKSARSGTYPDSTH